MHFNDSFGVDDLGDLVHNGFQLKQYICCWVINGRSCNAQVLGQDFPSHLKTVHGVKDTPRPKCMWDSCGEELDKGSIIRHVQEKHLENRWPCPTCAAIFTRRGVLETHRTTCGN